jgi:predicted Holliday junction resolvase-like endonuclease
MECPNIDKSPKDKFNHPINYKDLGGSVDYIFYDHIDAYGEITRVQFCKKMGRKRDVFQCLNEKEWKECSHYKAEI